MASITIIAYLLCIPEKTLSIISADYPGLKAASVLILNFLIKTKGKILGVPKGVKSSF